MKVVLALSVCVLFCLSNYVLSTSEVKKRATCSDARGSSWCRDNKYDCDHDINIMKDCQKTCEICTGACHDNRENWYCTAYSHWCPTQRSYRYDCMKSCKVCTTCGTHRYRITKHAPATFYNARRDCERLRGNLVTFPNGEYTTMLPCLDDLAGEAEFNYYWSGLYSVNKIPVWVTGEAFNENDPNFPWRYGGMPTIYDDDNGCFDINFNQDPLGVYNTGCYIKRNYFCAVPY